MQDLLKNENLSLEILDRLKRFYEKPLPDKGVLAGGAVANTILSLIDGGRSQYPINDLDVFRAGHPEQRESSTLPYHKACLGLQLDPYDGLMAVTKYGYQLVRSRRRGMLNQIFIKMTGSMWRDALPTVVEGFDLNACQAGIDLTSKKLYCSPEFLRFAATRQLQAVNCSTPYQTTARMLQKQEDLGCYLDLACESSFLSTYAANVDAHINRYGYRDASQHYSQFFGKKHYQQCQQFLDKLAPFCTPVQLETIPGTHEEADDIYRLEFQGDRLTELYQALEEQLQLSPGDHRPERWLINPYLYRNVFEKLFRPTTGRVQRNRFKMAISQPVTQLQALTLPAYSDCEFHPKHQKRIGKFVASHPRMILHLGKNIQEQFRSVCAIERAITRHGHLHIGLMEGMTKVPEITDAYIDQIVEDYKERFHGQLRKPLELRHFPLRSKVREVNTAADLVEHGARMHHCVGGYAESVRRGHSRIFEISHAGKTSTVQIVSSPYAHLYIGQHYGPFNAQVSKEEADIAEQLLFFIMRANLLRKMAGPGRIKLQAYSYTHPRRCKRLSRPPKEADLIAA